MVRALILMSTFALSSSLVEAQTPSSITLLAGPNPANLGATVTLTASVTAGATRKVTFYDGVTVLGTSMIASGQAMLPTIMLPADARSLHAHYLGELSCRRTVDGNVASGLRGVAISALGSFFSISN